MKFNPVRLKFLRETLVSQFKLDATAAQPLKGLRLLDIGCGGGLVSEPMTRMGASVTGVDASEANIKTAKVHAEENGLSIDYRHGTAEQLLEDGGPEQFDVVLNLEVVEHVANPDQFLRDCARMVKPGGMMIVGSINRTPRAFATAVGFVEGRPGAIGAFAAEQQQAGGGGPASRQPLRHDGFQGAEDRVGDPLRGFVIAADDGQRDIRLQDRAGTGDDGHRPVAATVGLNVGAGQSLHGVERGGRGDKGCRIDRSARRIV